MGNIGLTGQVLKPTVVSLLLPSFQINRGHTITGDVIIGVPPKPEGVRRDLPYVAVVADNPRKRSF